MGNKESFDSPVEHPRFSKVQYSASDDAMLVRQPLYSKTKQFGAWAEKQKLLTHIYNSPSLFICKNYFVQQKGACSDRGIFIGRFDGVFMRTLKEQIKLRAQEQKYFAEENIWYFILLVCKCASEIYDFGNHHCIGNLHPHNVLLNRRGQYKIIVSNYSFSLPGLLDNFMDFQLHGESQAYVSPEMIGFLYSTKYADYPNFPKCVNKQTAEAFSLGMTLLAMGTLNQEMSKVYKKYSRIGKARESYRMESSMNFIHSLGGSRRKIIASTTSRESNNSSEEDHYSLLLNSIKKRYSGVLYELILGLTHQNPEDRVSIDKTYKQLLKPIERNILIFDNRWIQKLKEHDFINEQSDLENVSKEICQKWARGQSYILKDQ